MIGKSIITCVSSFIFLAVTGFVANAQDMNSPPNSLVVSDTGDVGVGLEAPASAFHVQRSSDVQLRVESIGTLAERVMFFLKNQGKARFLISNGGSLWTFDNAGSTFDISKVGTGIAEMTLDGNGNMTIQGTLTENSSRLSKQGIVPVDVDDVLTKVLALPINRWEYKNDERIHHIGPMAEDFHAAFSVGRDEKGISTMDTSGVALAAIQGLHRKVLEKEGRIAELETQLAQLREMLYQLASENTVAIQR